MVGALGLHEGSSIFMKPFEGRLQSFMAINELYSVK